MKLESGNLLDQYTLMTFTDVYMEYGSKSGKLRLLPYLSLSWQNRRCSFCSTGGTGLCPCSIAVQVQHHANKATNCLLESLSLDKSTSTCCLNLWIRRLAEHGSQNNNHDGFHFSNVKTHMHHTKPMSASPIPTAHIAAAAANKSCPSPPKRQPHIQGVQCCALRTTVT